MKLETLGGVSEENYDPYIRGNLSAVRFLYCHAR